MAVEFVAAEFVRDLVARIAAARAEALVGFERVPAPGDPAEAAYWEAVLASNAAQVLRVLEQTRLRASSAVHYRFYSYEAGELRVRPFVAAADSELSTFRRLLEWHPPPDARTLASGRDAELLYRHFSFPRTAEGVFEYWFAMQELWASTYWAHARVLPTAEDLAAITAGEGWDMHHTVEHCAPAVVTEAEGSSHLAVLVYSRVRQQSVTLEQIEVRPDQTLRYGEPVSVASGPRGYLV